jgi:hypothetical protein
MPVLIDPRATIQLEGLSQFKNPMNSAVIEPENF